MNKQNVLNQIAHDANFFSQLNVHERERIKSLFNYGDAKSVEEKYFVESYDRWTSEKQNTFIERGRLQVAITPLKDDLSLDTDNKKYLHASQVTELNLNLGVAGFTGDITFAVPYDMKKETLWSEILFSQNVLVIEMSYQEDKLEQGKLTPNKENKWGITGYLDLSQDGYKDLKMSSSVSEHKTEHFLSCQLRFCDALPMLAKQHFPVSVLAKTTYQKLINTELKAWDSVLKLDFGEGLDAFMDTRPWVCMNCVYPEVSFYDFILRTLDHYQYQLSYDYQAEIPTYKVETLASAKNTQKVIEIAEDKVTEICWKPQAYTMAQTEIDNHYWSDLSKASTEPVSSILYPKWPTKRHDLSYLATSKQVDHLKQSLIRDLKYKGNSQSLLSLDFKLFPETSNVFPGSRITAFEQYQKKLGSESTDWGVISTKIQFKNHKWQPSYAGEHSLLIESVKVVDQHGFEAKNIMHDGYKLQHQIKLSAEVCYVDKTVVTLPSFHRIIDPLRLYGEVTDLDNSNKKTTYFVTSTTGNDPQDIDSTAQDKGGEYLPMHEHVSEQLSYVVKLPAKILSGNSQDSSDLSIMLPYQSPDDHQIFPLRKGTPVELKLDQESGEIIRGLWHSITDPSVSKKTQLNKMTFGADDAAGICHQAETKKLDEPTLEIFAKNSKNTMQIISDKDEMSILYQNAKSQS